MLGIFEENEPKRGDAEARAGRQAIVQQKRRLEGIRLGYNQQEGPDYDSTSSWVVSCLSELHTLPLQFTLGMREGYLTESSAPRRPNNKDQTILE